MELQSADCFGKFSTLVQMFGMNFTIFFALVDQVRHSLRQCTGKATGWGTAIKTCSNAGSWHVATWVLLKSLVDASLEWGKLHFWHWLVKNSWLSSSWTAVFNQWLDRHGLTKAHASQLGPFQLVWMQPVTTSQELIWQTLLNGQHGLWLESSCPRSLVEHVCLVKFDWSMVTVLTIVSSYDTVVIWC